MNIKDEHTSRLWTFIMKGEIMSKADKMFEELGYEKKRRYLGDEYIDKDGFSIYFLNTGLIKIGTIDGTGEYTISGLSLKELQAINKKVEELGWIERN